MPHFILTHLLTGQRFDFELCDAKDHVPAFALAYMPNRFFWVCDDADAEGSFFADPIECVQHAMQWVRDYVLAQEVEAEAEQCDPRYRSLAQFERLSDRQLGVP